jgi:NAD(P)-dependent dehydrogenase (short-subunit alcohol dehydrogenase family)
MQLDLGCLESVRNFGKEFCKKYDRLDILINNGAVMLNPTKHLKTSDGFEIHFGVNHLGIHCIHIMIGQDCNFSYFIIRSLSTHKATPR